MFRHPGELKVVNAVRRKFHKKYIERLHFAKIGWTCRKYLYVKKPRIVPLFEIPVQRYEKYRRTQATPEVIDGANYDHHERGLACRLLEELFDVAARPADPRQGGGQARH